MKVENVTREKYESIVNDLGVRAIDGSHVANLMCPDYKYGSPYKLFKEITECRNHSEMTEAAKAGIDLEAWVVKEFLKRNPRFCVKKESIGANLISTDDIKEHPFVIAAIDRIIFDKNTGKQYLLECKTTDSVNADKWEDDSMPDNYYWQCIHYMWISGIQDCIVACFIGFTNYKELRLSASSKQIKDDIALLESTLKNFWNNHVLTGVAPDVDGKSETRKTLDEQAGTRELVTSLPPRVVNMINKLPELREQADAIKKEIEYINQSVIASMRSFGKLKQDGFSISYNNISKEGFDTAKFKLDNPILYEQYKKTSTYTSLSVRQTKRQEEANEN